MAADGTLDASFDPGANDAVFGLAEQADGKILLAGQFTSAAGAARKGVARVLADGTLDAGFNPNPNNFVFCMAVQPDGKILLGGNFTNINGTGRSRIARVTASGALDTGFSANTNSPGSADVYSVALQRDGSVLLGGQFTTVGGVARQHLARVSSTGAVDTGFNPNVNDAIYSILVQADDQIILGGFFTSVGSTARNYIARVAANGTLDAGFNPNANGFVNSVALQADGRVLMGGQFTTVGGSAHVCFARLLISPATQTLNATDTTQVLWTRSGSTPDVLQATLEVSTNGGASYSPVSGTFARVGTTANWQFSGLSLPANGQLRVRGRNVGGGNNGSIGWVQQVWAFGGLLPPVDLWRQTIFGTTSNSGNAADASDPDQDGLANLIEYAFGLSPTLPGGSSQLPSPVLSGSNIVISFTAPGGVGGITYGAEWSHTMLAGSWTSIPDTGTPPQHLFIVPQGNNGSRFVRLKVTSP